MKPAPGKWFQTPGVRGFLEATVEHRDGTVRDSVMYSILAAEWPDVKRHLELRLTRYAK